MPLDIQIPYRGDAYLFQGISGGASSMATGAEQAIKRFKQIQDAGKAADYFMKAGGDEMYSQLGIHPEEWKTLGPRDKMQAVEGLLQARHSQQQAEQTQALAEERKARAAQLQEHTAEGEAWPEFMRQLQELQGTSTGTNAAAPAPQAWNPTDFMNPAAMEMTGPAAPAPAGAAAPAPGAMFSRENLVQAASRMGKTNPKMAAAMMRMFMPQIMGNSEQPRAWQSPEGNPYVMYHNTLMADKQPFDPATLMGNAPEGFQAVPTGPNRVQYLKTSKDLPASFHSTLDTIGSDIASAQATLAQPETAFRNAEEAKTMKGYAQRRLEGAQKRGKQTLERYHTAGYMTDAELADYHEQLGLPAPKAKAAAKPSAAGRDGKVLVQKGDKQFWLPKAQLADAISEGYTEVTK